MRTGFCKSRKTHTLGAPQAQSQRFMLDQDAPAPGGKARVMAERRGAPWWTEPRAAHSRLPWAAGQPLKACAPLPQGGAGSEERRSVRPSALRLQAARATSPPAVSPALPWGPGSSLEGDEPDTVTTGSLRHLGWVLEGLGRSSPEGDCVS